jgi:hypothetical protein
MKLKQSVYSSCLVVLLNCSDVPPQEPIPSMKTRQQHMFNLFFEFPTVRSENFEYWFIYPSVVSRFPLRESQILNDKLGRERVLKRLLWMKLTVTKISAVSFRFNALHVSPVFNDQK